MPHLEMHFRCIREEMGAESLLEYLEETRWGQLFDRRGEIEVSSVTSMLVGYISTGDACDAIAMRLRCDSDAIEM